jgi:nicotinate-nucleotide--dimethylbenzimidazole phosphoribosyltransferase
VQAALPREVAAAEAPAALPREAAAEVPAALPPEAVEAVDAPRPVAAVVRPAQWVAAAVQPAQRAAAAVRHVQQVEAAAQRARQVAARRVPRAEEQDALRPAAVAHARRPAVRASRSRERAKLWRTAVARRVPPWRPELAFEPAASSMPQVAGAPSSAAWRRAPAFQYSAFQYSAQRRA